MSTLDLLNQIFEVCVIPLLGILTTYVVQLLQTKTKEIKQKAEYDKVAKYNAMILQTIQDCLVATNQTYVNSLKEQGKFDLNAQKTALKQTYNAVLVMLSKEIKDYITETSGDLETYIIQLIESQIGYNK